MAAATIILIISHFKDSFTACFIFVSFSSAIYKKTGKAILTLPEPWQVFTFWPQAKEPRALFLFSVQEVPSS
jgi:hypothetical protein